MQSAAAHVTARSRWGKILEGRGDGATYRITLATAGALRSWQTPVSLLSGLTRGSDQTDQTWVTLRHTKIRVEQKLKGRKFILSSTYFRHNNDNKSV